MGIVYKSDINLLRGGFSMTPDTPLTPISNIRFTLPEAAGFTLMELMVTIAIMGILMAIGVPNYIAHRNNQQVSRAAREIYSALQSAKMTAIRENTPVNVLFTTGTGSNGRYQIFEDMDGDDAVDAGEEIKSGQMPPGVTMQAAAFAGGVNFTRFTRIGLTTGRNGTVSVTNGSRNLNVVVNTVGGVRIN